MTPSPDYHEHHSPYRKTTHIHDRIPLESRLHTQQLPLLLLLLLRLNFLLVIIHQYRFRFLLDNQWLHHLEWFLDFPVVIDDVVVGLSKRFADLGWLRADASCRSSSLLLGCGYIIVVAILGFVIDRCGLDINTVLNEDNYY